jgi:hypothetical protein
MRRPVRLLGSTAFVSDFTCASAALLVTGTLMIGRPHCPQQSRTLLDYTVTGLTFEF